MVLRARIDVRLSTSLKKKTGLSLSPFAFPEGKRGLLPRPRGLCHQNNQGRKLVERCEKVLVKKDVEVEKDKFFLSGIWGVAKVVT